MWKVTLYACVAIDLSDVSDHVTELMLRWKNKNMRYEVCSVKNLLNTLVVQIEQLVRCVCVRGH